MFAIENKSFGKFKIVELQNKNSGEFAAVNIDFGAAIQQIGLRKNDKVIEVLDTYSSPEAIINDFSQTYKGAKLFPFPNMVKNGQYIFEGINYQLPLNWVEDGHSIHGFVADKTFKVIEKIATDDGAFVIVNYEHGICESYPFSFLLTIKYSLTSNGFSATTTVSNTGQKSMPYGDGWHPYFLFDEMDADNVFLKLPPSAVVEIDEHFIPTGKMIENRNYINFNQLGNLHLDTCFHLDCPGAIAVTQLWHKQKDIGINIWQQTGREKYNYVLIYTPPGRKSIAVEPMTCAPDAFNNHQGLILLKPSEVFEASFGVQLF